MKLSKVTISSLVFALLFTGTASQLKAAGTGMNGNPIVDQITDATSTTTMNFGSLSTDLQALVDNGHSGTAALVVKDGKIIYNQAFGYQSRWSADPDVFTTHGSIPLATLESIKTATTDDTDTMWDMASVTKVLSTNLALQKLVYEGHLDLDATVSTYIGCYVDNPADLALLEPSKQITGKDETTIRDLLHHTAGQFADPNYHSDNYLKSVTAQNDFGYLNVGTAYDQLFSQNITDYTDRESITNAICKTPLINKPNTAQVYSDVDYMLLGLIIEKITGMPQNEYVQTNIYAPLGLTRTMYLPLDNGITLNEIAATEINGNTRDGYRTSTGPGAYAFSFENMRTGLIQGEVQDEKTYYSMNGVAGHAGLFSTPKEVAILMQLMLNNGTYNGVTLFNEETVNQFLTPSDVIQASGFRTQRYALGWWLNDLDYAGGGRGWGSYFSSYAPYITFGHQGWTGPVAFADPINNIIVVYMRNRPNNPVDVSTAARLALPNTFQNAGTSGQTYTMVANHVYKDGLNKGATDIVSSLPGFDSPLGEITNNFTTTPNLKIDVNFIDPLLQQSAGKIGSGLGRNPRWVRVDVGAPAPELPTDNGSETIPDNGWAIESKPLTEPEWSTDGGTYSFVATQAGDYYISLYDSSGAKMIKWITILESAPTNSPITPTATPEITAAPTATPASNVIIQIPNTATK